MTTLGPYGQILAAAQQQLLACLTGPPKLSYSVDGRTFSWKEYQEYLKEQIDWAQLKVMEEEEGPWEHETRILA
jgi:hypothetical protein